MRCQRHVAIKTAADTNNSIDIKTGKGGIRDIEFLVQGLQMINAPDHPDLLTGNTLDALALLDTYELLPADVVQTLEQDYCFLRQVEHYLQILEDRQIHSLPRSETELTALARRICGIHTTAEEFTEQITTCLTRVRTTCQSFLENSKF